MYELALKADVNFLLARMELAWILLKNEKLPEQALVHFYYILEKLKVIPVIYKDAYEGFLLCLIQLKGKNVVRAHLLANKMLLEPQKKELWKKIRSSQIKLQ